MYGRISNHAYTPIGNGFFIRLVVSIFLLVFLLVGLFGLQSMFVHSMHHANCPLMPEMSLCNSSLLDHIDRWQSMFSVTLAPLLIGMFLLAAYRQRFVFRTLALRPVHIRVHARESDNPLPFQLLFSQGILNSKAF